MTDVVQAKKLRAQDEASTEPGAEPDAGAGAGLPPQPYEGGDLYVAPRAAAVTAALEVDAVGHDGDAAGRPEATPRAPAPGEQGLQPEPQQGGGGAAASAGGGASGAAAAGGAAEGGPAQV